MPKKVYKTTRKYQCPYCNAKYPRMDLITHVEKKHPELIPEEYTASRVVYEAINKTDHGTCMVCKKPVYTWNDKLCRYNNLCDNPKCRETVRKTALERHMRVYNKPTLLNDPDHQEKMLARRKISGTYKHSDGGELTYTAKFEKNTLEFMDKIMNIPSKDIQCPGPVFYYELNGEKHFYISDIYYIPANLVIECKDGGDNPNKREMPEYRAKQAAKEEMMTKQGKFNYLRLTNNNFAQLLEALADIKYANMEGDTNSPRFYINEATNFSEEVTALPSRSTSSTWIEPILMGQASYAIGSDDYDKVIVSDTDGNTIKVIDKKEYEESYHPSHKKYVLTSEDAGIRFLNACKKSTMREALVSVIRRKNFIIVDEITLFDGWKYVDESLIDQEYKMLHNGVIRENDILSGDMKVFDNPERPIKGSVFMTQTMNGVFLHTPTDYYLASDIFPSVEVIPQNVIDTMNDLYNQYKARMVDNNG